MISHDMKKNYIKYAEFSKLCVFLHPNNNKLLILTIMRKTLLLLSLIIAGSTTAFAQLSPFDENAPIGWASVGEECTGSNDTNPVTVSTYDELKSALQACKGGKASKTIYICGNIEVPEKLRYDKMQNCTIYGLPGSSLYNRSHNDNADNAGFFYCQNWHNVIMRNLTLLGAGAYDISACDNIQLVESDHIWIDHCDIQDGVDGNLDAKTKSDHMTITWCKFSYLIAPWPKSGESDDHRCSSMWGSSDNRGDDEGFLNATFANCWWYHGCGQRCPRIRFGKVHIVNCLWENGTEEDPAQYCIGIGHSSKMYIENSDFTKTVIKSGQSNMRGHNKYFLQDNKLYHFTMTGCMGEDDAVEIGAGYKGTVYNPYDDANYKCRVYDVAYVADILRNPDNGAGATLKEDQLATRGNADYGNYTPSLIQGVSTMEPQVVAIRYYDLKGAQLRSPQKGLNIISYQMSDGTTVTNKIMK